MAESPETKRGSLILYSLGLKSLTNMEHPHFYLSQYPIHLLKLVFQYELVISSIPF